jgi:cell division protein FtsB
MRDGFPNSAMPTGHELPPKVRPGRARGRWTTVGVVAGLSAVLALAMHLPQELVELNQNRARIRQLHEETNNLRKRRDEKLERLRNLRENYAEQELEIRRNFNLHKPGDTIYILPPKAAPSTETPAAESKN